jgi:3-mercaptopyruvate sulfurtransferase SseA
LEIVMRFIIRVSCCIALASVTAGAQKPTDARDALVVSTTWLAQHLEDPNLVVLFLGDDNDYNKAHIPGSYNVQMEEFAVDDMSASGLMLEVLPADRLRDSLGALGITDRSRIVVYAGQGFVPWATRFITGASTGQGHAGPHRSGHIASAKNVSFNAPYTDDGFVRPTAELRALFDKAGVAPGDTVIGYCHIGQQATAMLFAARVLGHPVRLYDGSFEDWSRHPAAEYVVEGARGEARP